MAGKDTGPVVKSPAKSSGKTEPPRRETPAPQYAAAAIVQQTLDGSAPLDSRKVLHLQRTIGNRAVGQLLEGRRRAIQAKLTVGAADDAAEGVDGGLRPSVRGRAPDCDEGRAVVERCSRVAEFKLLAG